MIERPINKKYYSHVRKQHCCRCGNTPSLAHRLLVKREEGGGIGGLSLESYHVIPLCLDCQQEILQAFVGDQWRDLDEVMISIMSSFVKDRKKLFNLLCELLDNECQ